MKAEVLEMIQKFINKQFFTSVVIIAFSILIYQAINFILTKSEKSKVLNSSKRGKTYIKLIKSIFRNIFIIVTFLIVLDVNGVDVSSALTGVGIVGVVLGLAMQDWIKDIIRGSTIISDNYFSVGDIVRYKDMEGRVKVIGLKSTRIQELKTGYIRTIANRNIEEIDIVSNYFHINVPMPYELKIEKAEEIVEKIAKTIEHNDNVIKCTYIGVEDLEASFINYRLRIECNTLFKLQVRRDALTTVLKVMEQEGISVPYTQIDIHEK